MKTEDYLCATDFFDYQHSRVQAFIHTTLTDIADDPLLQIQALYLAVRDSIRYNPYVYREDPKTLSASFALTSQESYCIPKAVLLGASARAIGIPSRLGLSDVRNHLSSPQLIKHLQSDIFRMHGYIELFLNNRWVKATPAFNAQLCQLMNIAPLEFDGIHDSIFHAYTADGQQHMEYINDYGHFVDVPYRFITEQIRTHYPHLFEANSPLHTPHSLEADVTELS